MKEQCMLPHGITEIGPRTFSLALLIVSMLLFSSYGLAQISNEERIAIGYIDAHNNDGLALLERLVNMNSGTMNKGGVQKVGAAFRAEFDALEFRTSWIDGSAFQRAGHLVADHPGPGPRMLLIGHLDTVFEESSPFQKFERLDAKTARGPGVIDIKGGDVIIIQALKALREAGSLKAMSIIVVLTGDEESPGQPIGLARDALVTAAKDARAAIGIEPADGDPAHAVTARRGIASWQLEVTAKSGHSSQIFGDELGSGAVFEAARILDAFRQRLAGEPHLTFNPGLIVGGTSTEYSAEQAKGSASGKVNVVAARANVIGDVRTLSGEQLSKARTTMTEIVRDSLPGTSAKISFTEMCPPLAPKEGNQRLLDLYSRCSSDLGLGAVTAGDPDKAGAADVSFVSQVPMVMDGVGLKGRGAHSSDETADLTTFPTQAKRLVLLLSRFGK